MMPLILLMIVVLGIAVYWWRTGPKIGSYVRQMGQDVRHHRLTAGLLLLYGVICGGMFVGGFSPILVGLPLALPLVAGVLFGWWEAQRDAGPDRRDLLVGYGLLAGCFAMLLPAVMLIAANTALVLIGDAELPMASASDFLAETVGWALGMLVFGAIFGALGAFGGTAIAHSAGRPQR